MKDFARYKKDRGLYIIGAAVEYLIALTVSGSFLAKLTTSLGISDTLTGIISSFISLGCTFQLLSPVVFRRSRSRKGFVFFFGVINELLFTLLYVVPLVPMSTGAKSAVFVLMILMAYVTMNLLSPVKVAWYMSMVEDNNRGVFTATKEIISLVAGIVFTLIMGALADRFEAQGNMSAYFIITAFVVLTMAISHCTCYALTKDEEEKSSASAVNPLREMGSLLKNPDYLRVIAICVVWNVGNCIATPFFGVYLIKELGFSMTRVSVYSFISSGCRMLFTRLLGRYADRKGFLQMMVICVGIATVSFLFNIFSAPATGKVFYLIYTCLHAIAMGGINSGLFNLVFDVLDVERCRSGLAIQNTVYGVCGFLATLAASPLIARIQSNGNTFLGIPAYAQQVVSFFSFVILTALTVYLFFYARRKARPDPGEPQA